MRAFLPMAFLLLVLVAPRSGAKEWTIYEKCSLVDGRLFDGDSFNVRAQTGYT